MISKGNESKNTQPPPPSLSHSPSELFAKLETTLITVQQNKVRKQAKIRKRFNQIPHLALDIILESDKNIRKRHIQESQEVIPFPTGDHKAARNRQNSITDKHETHITKRIHKRSTALERSVKTNTEGLKHV